MFTAERIRAYEQAQLASGFRVYRDRRPAPFVRRAGGPDGRHRRLARRRAIGHQHDTSVVRSHRGHRLGLLLKADMMRWLAEVEPQLETVDTFNAESNAHMVARQRAAGLPGDGRPAELQ